MSAPANAVSIQAYKGMTNSPECSASRRKHLHDSPHTQRPPAMPRLQLVRQTASKHRHNGGGLQTTGSQCDAH